MPPSDPARTHHPAGTDCGVHGNVGTTAKNIFFEIHHDLPREGPGRNLYTRQAFQMLPPLVKPRILDIGCGPGEQTLELARLCSGEIVGLDTHQPYLDTLVKKAETERLSDRVTVTKRSMFEIDFPDESFDLIWAEGSIYIIGFSRGLREWKRLLKPEGFLVAHDIAWIKSDPPREISDYLSECYPDIATVEERMKLIPECSYSPVAHFILPDDAWWPEYYHPLENRIKDLTQKYRNDPEAVAMLESETKEVEMFRKFGRWYGAVFFLMQKTR